MKSYIITMLGLAYAGEKDGRRCWTSPDCAIKYKTMFEATLVTSLLLPEGLPVKITR